MLWDWHPSHSERNRFNYSTRKSLRRYQNDDYYHGKHRKSPCDGSWTRACGIAWAVATTHGCGRAEDKGQKTQYVSECEALDFTVEIPSNEPQIRLLEIAAAARRRIPSTDGIKGVIIGSVIGAALTSLWSAIALRVAEQSLDGDRWERILGFRIYCSSQSVRVSPSRCLLDGQLFHRETN